MPSKSRCLSTSDKFPRCTMSEPLRRMECLLEQLQQLDMQLFGLIGEAGRIHAGLSQRLDEPDPGRICNAGKRSNWPSAKRRSTGDRVPRGSLALRAHPRGPFDMAERKRVAHEVAEAIRVLLGACPAGHASEAHLPRWPCARSSQAQPPGYVCRAGPERTISTVRGLLPPCRHSGEVASAVQREEPRAITFVPLCTGGDRHLTTHGLSPWL